MAIVKSFTRKPSENNMIMERVKVSFQRFCDATSMHGFSELYHAKTTFWKIFWYICIGGAIIMTGYQIFSAVRQYTNQSTATSIEAADENQIVYPPLKICYTHWLQWVNFEKGYHLGFTKPAILYGLSFLSRIYSLDRFNISEAKDNFTLSLSVNNLTTLSQFYNAISKYAPLRFFDQEFYDFNYSFTGGPYFMNTEFVPYQQGCLLFCHVEGGKDILTYIKTAKAYSDYSSKANTLTFATNDENYFGHGPQEITKREYNSYMAEWIQERTPQYWIFDDFYEEASHDYTNFNAPMILFPDGYNSIGIKMEPEIDEYFVTIKASAHKWKNTLKNPCAESEMSVVSDLSCANLCMDKNNYIRGKMDIFDNRFRLGEDQPDNNIYQYNFYFINEISTSTNNWQTDSSSDFSPTTMVSLADINTTVSQENGNDVTMSGSSKKENCTQKCIQGCEKWNFEISVTTSSIYNSIHQVASKKRTNIRIDYPLDGDVMIITESDFMSWENFVGNVGGLLGIWTGASIISFVQLFYLCCCADMEFHLAQCHAVTFKRKRQPAKKMHRIRTIVVNPKIKLTKEDMFCEKLEKSCQF